MCRLLTGLVALAGILATSGGALARTAEIRDVRLWTAPDNTRIVFDLTRAVEYRVFQLHQPERVVIDLERATLRAALTGLPLPDPVVASIRHGRPKKHVLRVVLDVKERVAPRTFLLKPMQGKPYRLVVDLKRPEVARKEAMEAARLRNGKELIVAIDAGHGGEDPGAIGPHGVREKDVTLAVAKRLARLVDARPGMKALLTRKGDYYLPLVRRYQIARAAHADLFISIHADSVRRGEARGASVYTLSERGATPDKAAAALAAKENAADEIGGEPILEIEDPEVERILSDMFRRDSLESSQILAEELLTELRRVGPVKYLRPKRARFVVLGAMEIPSVLVELDFISNPRQERRLRDPRHQERMAKALLAGSLRFLKRMGRLGSGGGGESASASMPLAAQL